MNKMKAALTGLWSGVEQNRQQEKPQEEGREQQNAKEEKREQENTPQASQNSDGTENGEENAAVGLDDVNREGKFRLPGLRDIGIVWNRSRQAINKAAGGISQKGKAFVVGLVSRLPSWVRHDTLNLINQVFN